MLEDISGQSFGASDDDRTEGTDDCEVEMKDDRAEAATSGDDEAKEKRRYGLDG